MASSSPPPNPSKPPKEENKPTEEQIRPQKPAQNQPPPGMLRPTAPPDESSAPPEATNRGPPEEEDAESRHLKSGSLEAFDKMSLKFGPNLWTTSGAVSTAATIPPWIINNVLVETWTPISDTLIYSLLGGVAYGTTGQGSFIGFSAGGRFGYSLGFDTEGGNALFILGSSLVFESIGVTGERFGGIDVLKLGLFAMMADQFSFESMDMYLDLSGTFTIFPVASGQGGTSGGKRPIGSVSAFGIGIEGVFSGSPEDDTGWGAFLDINLATYTLSTISLAYNQIFLGAIFAQKF